MKLEFVKKWENPKNAEKKAPIACYQCTTSSIISILQYAENDFRPPVNHIMSLSSPKSFRTLEEAVAYVNNDEWE